MIEIPQAPWIFWLHTAMTSICASYTAVAFLVMLRTGSRNALWWGLMALLTGIISGSLALLQAERPHIPHEILIAIQRWVRFGIVVILAFAINDVLSSSNGRTQGIRRILQWWKWGKP